MKYIITFAISIFGMSLQAQMQTQARLCDPAFYAQQGVTAYHVNNVIEVNGEDPNQTCWDAEGRQTTPLHVAVANTQNEQVLIALIMRSANLLATNWAGQTPYDVLLRMEQEQYGKLQQATYRWKNLAESEYEEAQRRIAQKLQVIREEMGETDGDPFNEWNEPPSVDKLQKVSEEINEAWKELGETPVQEAQARFDQINAALEHIRFFTDLSWAMRDPARDAYTPVVVDVDYDESEDVQDFLRFVNEKLVSIGIEPLVTSVSSNTNLPDEASQPNDQEVPFANLPPVFAPVFGEVSQNQDVFNDGEALDRMINQVIGIINTLSSIIDDIDCNGNAECEERLSHVRTLFNIINEQPMASNNVLLNEEDIRRHAQSLQPIVVELQIIVETLLSLNALPLQWPSVLLLEGRDILNEIYAEMEQRFGDLEWDEIMEQRSDDLNSIRDSIDSLLDGLQENEVPLNRDNMQILTTPVHPESESESESTPTIPNDTTPAPEESIFNDADEDPPVERERLRLLNIPDEYVEPQSQIESTDSEEGPVTSTDPDEDPSVERERLRLLNIPDEYVEPQGQNMQGGEEIWEEASPVVDGPLAEDVSINESAELGGNLSYRTEYGNSINIKGSSIALDTFSMTFYNKLLSLINEIMMADFLEDMNSPDILSVIFSDETVFRLVRVRDTVDEWTDITTNIRDELLDLLKPLTQMERNNEPKVIITLSAWPTLTFNLSQEQMDVLQRVVFCVEESSDLESCLHGDDLAVDPQRTLK